MSQVLEEFVTVLGLEVDQQKFQNATKKISDVKNSFFGVKSAVTLAVAAVTEFERRIALSGTHLSNAANAINISTDQFQILDFAAKATGGSIESVTGAISSLQNEIEGFKVGKGISEGLLRGAVNLGIDPTQFQSGIKLFEEFMKRLDTIKDSSQRSAIGNLAFGGNFREIERIYKAQGDAEKKLRSNDLLLSPEKIKQLQEVNAQFALMGKVFSNTFQEIAVALKPVFDELTRKIVEMTPEIKNAAESFSKWLTDPDTLESLKTVADGIGVIASGLMLIAKAAGYVGEAFKIVGTGIGQGVAATKLATEDIVTGILGSHEDRLRTSMESQKRLQATLSNGVFGGAPSQASQAQAQNNTTNNSVATQASNITNNYKNNTQNTTNINYSNPNNLYAQFAFGRVL